MVAVEAGPELVAQGGHSARCVLDYAPAEVGLVGRDLIEEVVGEDGLLSCNEVLLLLVLDWASVHPSVKGEGSVASKSAEGLVDGNLVQRGEFVGATRHGGTCAIDLSNGGGETVELSQVLWWQDDTSCCVDDLRRLI